MDWRRAGDSESRVGVEMAVAMLAAGEDMGEGWQLKRCSGIFGEDSWW